MKKTTKRFSSIFDLASLAPKIYSPESKFSQNRLQIGLYAR